MPLDIFSSDFKRSPYWWEEYSPPDMEDGALPDKVDVLVVGGGYTGVACALALAQAGADALVLDARQMGYGASTRSGGQVSGGVNVQKKAMAATDVGEAEREARLENRIRDAGEGLTLLEDLIARHAIDCGWHKTGRYTALWSPEHYPLWEARLPRLNWLADSRASMVSKEALRAEVGSDIYHGGVLIERAGHLHPARYYGGLLAAALAAGARARSGTEVLDIARDGGGFVVKTSRGAVRAGQVALATNGYSGAVAGPLRRSVVPVTSHMIATEPLSKDLIASILPTNRAVSESRRVVNHYRLSPDGTRLLFGGRARFTPASEHTTARLLYKAMLKRFPQLAGSRITHSWGGNVAMTLDYLPHIGSHQGLHYALGCNGSGVVMMTYLGHSLGRKIASGQSLPINAFDTGEMPRHALYYGNPWFLFAIGSWYQCLDARDQRRARGA
jgi:glycine/D-amino acid oxidase-like deaminating enzyme